MAPEELLADSLYGSDSNCEHAREKYNVEVIAPAMPGNQKKMHLAEFTLDDTGRIITCPRGIEPENLKQNNGSYSAAFPVSICSTCPDFKQCPVKEGKKFFYYRYKEKDIRIARRRQKEDSAVFKDKYRFRAGVEATMSEFDRRTGVKHLRVRGIKAVTFAVLMKAIGLNIFRASRFRKRQNAHKAPPRGIHLAFFAIYRLVKEQFKRKTAKFTVIVKKIRLRVSRRPTLSF